MRETFDKLNDIFGNIEIQLIENQYHIFLNLNFPEC